VRCIVGERAADTDIEIRDTVAECCVATSFPFLLGSTVPTRRDGKSFALFYD